jgi:serpin B
MPSAHRSRTSLLLALLASLTSAGFAACSGGSPTAPATEMRSDKVRVTSPVLGAGDLATLATDNRHFAWDLYQAVRPTPGNLVFSPASISLALAMAYGGARGTTATQMATTLHFSLPTERLHPTFDALDLALETPAPGDAGSFRLSLANALWGQQGFQLLPDYLDLLAVNYGAGVHVVDFAGATEPARLTINQWVSDQTEAKIPDLLAPGVLGPLTVLVLTNAVYFHADWRTPFAAMSQDGAFQTPTGPVQVPMMAGADEAAASWTGSGYKAAALPYAGGTTSMLLIVPDAGTFDAFESGLTFDALEAILSTLSTPSSGVLLSMPRFNLKTGLGLKNTLAALGMADAFSGAADFSGIDGGRDLFISSVIHQAMVAVDEKGTEAAAATAVTFMRKAALMGESLVVDRPFLFAIRDDATGTILFLGRVVDPSKM